MNRYILFFILILVQTCSFAQQKSKFSIASFDVDPFDLSASDRQYEKVDGSGVRYAIIKVTTNNPNDNLNEYQFDFGNLRSFVEDHDGVLWVYVQKNAKLVTISRKGYVTINKYDLHTTIEAGKNYVMSLSSEAMPIYNRFLQFNVSPKNEHAIIKVKRDGNNDWDFWGEVDANGSKAKNIELGKYTYEIVADHYERSQGRVTLTYASEPFVENVTLTPNFGFLEVSNTYGFDGAEIYVDDKKIGTIPYKSNDRWEVKDGYRIMISNGDMYKTYNATFSIHKGETTRLSPKIEANYAETTIQVGDDAEIFLNGESKGIGKWSGALKAGAYDVECRKEKCYSTRKQIVVKADVSEIFVIDAPKPIVGRLTVNSNPLGAMVEIDGKQQGNTPLSIEAIQIGEHSITLKTPDYKTISESFTIEEKRATNLDFTLRNIARITIESKPTGAMLYMNGVNKGMTPFTEEMASGDYDIKAELKGFQKYVGRIHLDSSNPSFVINMSRQYQQKNQFYIQPSVQFGSAMMVGGTVGFYAYNVNVEASCLLGTSGCETIYWNSFGNDAVRPEAESFTPSVVSGRVGYGIVIGSRLRITPQAGAGIVMLNGDKHTKCNVTKATIGCKADYVLCNHVSVNITPEYGFAITKSETYKRLEPVSSKIKSIGGGIGCSFGLTFFF